jgi:hypothetical protein
MNKDEYKLIESLSKQETAMANLYAAFGEALPSMHVFWNRLVAEENAHANVIWKLSELCKTAGARINTRAFNIETVHTNIEYLDRHTADVKANGISPVKALSIALDTERGLIDKQFFRAVESKDPSFSDELSAIQEHTSEHLHRIEDRLKQEQENAIHRSVTDGQLAVILKLKENETLLAQLYRLYAASAADMYPFWTSIAMAEDRHAAALQELADGVLAGKAQINPERFPASGLALLSQLVFDAITAAKTQSVNAKAAIVTALTIESSMIDHEFYATIESDDEQYRRIVHKLETETNQHIRSLQQELKARKGI